MGALSENITSALHIHISSRSTRRNLIARLTAVRYLRAYFMAKRAKLSKRQRCCSRLLSLRQQLLYMWRANKLIRRAARSQKMQCTSDWLAYTINDGEHMRSRWARSRLRVHERPGACLSLIHI